MVQHLPENAEANFKCSRCGHMFGIHGKREAACPHCGFTCTAETCRVVDASNEDY